LDDLNDLDVFDGFDDYTEIVDMTRVQEKNLDRRFDWLYTRGVIVVMSTFLEQL
jgi:hypothetical protein